MKLINPTPYPAIAFEGIDQLEQMFHVVVMRQTYTWDDTGLLIATEEQRPIRLADRLIDPDDVMSGIIEESDLAHYKPKCDVIIQGHAYAPPHAHGKSRFQATVTLQVPNSKIPPEPDSPHKYPHIELRSTSQQTSRSQVHPVKGQTLINKTLNIHSPSHAIAGDDSMTGRIYYRLQETTYDLKKDSEQKISLNPQTSFGGYRFIEDSDTQKLTLLLEKDKEALIAGEDRDIRLNPSHGSIAYMEQDNYNPYGTGYLSPLYHQAIKPKSISLPQVQPTTITIERKQKKLIDVINSMVKEPLETNIHEQLAVGFGNRSKSHPKRCQYIGKVDNKFIDSEESLPQGFDFAVWNSAYPNQQTDFLKGNEWLTLTNLCSHKTVASHLSQQGDIELKLYLSEATVSLALTSNNPNITDADMPMTLDTLIIRPDKHEATVVWRAMIVGDYHPKTATLSMLEKPEQDEIIDTHFTRVSWLDRPYTKASM